MKGMEHLRKTDPMIGDLIEREYQRQKNGIELIASENYPSLACMEAAGSILTCKYAEGYPGHRYYGGCEIVDEIEQLAIDRCKELFRCEHVNVQPHSGTSANLAAFAAVLKPGDRVLAMDLQSGGHLSFVSKLSINSAMYQAQHYGVGEDGYLDYDAIEKQAMEWEPKLILAGASAYPREINFKRFREIADKCGAILMADISHIAGLVAAGLHMSPIPYADIVTTTTHKTLRSLRGAVIMCKEKYAKAIDRAVFPMTQGGPCEHIIAAKAVSFWEALQPEFKMYQANVVNNIQVMAEVFDAMGIKMVSGGSDNHLILLDLSEQGKTGKEVEELLGRCGITVNKNMIPNDTRGASETSGIRIGTAAITSRGMGAREARWIALRIAELILYGDTADEETIHMVQHLCEEFPLYRELEEGKWQKFMKRLNMYQ